MYGVAYLVGGGASQKASVVRRGSAYGEEVELFVSYGPVELFVPYGPIELCVLRACQAVCVIRARRGRNTTVPKGGDQTRR